MNRNFTWKHLESLKRSIKSEPKGLGEKTALRMVEHFQTCIHNYETVQEENLDLREELSTSKTPQCERCGTTGTAAVTWDVDPFMLEIHDKEVWKWLCRACHHEYCMDI